MAATWNIHSFTALGKGETVCVHTSRKGEKKGNKPCVALYTSRPDPSSCLPFIKTQESYRGFFYRCYRLDKSLSFFQGGGGGPKMVNRNNAVSIFIFIFLNSKKKKGKMRNSIVDLGLTATFWFIFPFRFRRHFDKRPQINKLDVVQCDSHFYS